MSTMTDLGKALTGNDCTETFCAEHMFGDQTCPIRAKNPKNDRLVIRFDPTTTIIFRGDKLDRRIRLRGATLLQYVVNTGNRTPTGGLYTSRRMTVRTADGRKWVGQTKNGTDVVRLRPAPVVKVK